MGLRLKGLLGSQKGWQGSNHDKEQDETKKHFRREVFWREKSIMVFKRTLLCTDKKKEKKKLPVENQACLGKCIPKVL